MIKHQKLKYYLLIIFQITPVYLEAASSCTEWVAKVVSVQGKVETLHFGTANWKAIQQGDVFCRGDKIRSETNSRATLKLSNNSLISVDQNTNLNFSVPKVEAVSSWLIELFKGSAFFRSRESQRLNIDTPFINAVHEGTEFLVTVDAEQTEITVFDGQVAATNQQGKINIKKGFTGIAKKGEAPRVKALTIRPEDAVQWTLYYPPIIDYQHFKSAAFKPAIDAYGQGNTYQSLDMLKTIPIDQQDGDYLVLKSSLLLTVGRVEEALELIKQARTLKQDESSAIALQSVIAITKNRQDEALKFAQQAVTLNPQSTIAQIALSYAYQSNFKIEPALQATEEAIRLSPDNALAWARLSELQLSTGERSDALESAKKAQALNPQLSRTHTILGFANLAEVDIDEAKTAFNQAIKLNSADPLARLGLALAKIRKGDVEEGTLDLETAVSLDPDNAIMRSYLGKAYYELKNDGYAETELTIAKEMDAKDPTSWFYDAIRKQTTNRSVEALHDMQKAIELNDNRGVYRSKLLLDEDLAARTASLARIYDNLGFKKLALLEARKSINADPTNYSAHRFFGETASRNSRNRIARVSELLQAQLLQPINITPIQPQMKETTFSLVNGSGPANLSLNEFNPLFSENQANIIANGVFGSNNTLSDEIIISGIYNKFSGSFGQYHFQTDGFRKNDDLKQDVYTAFIQTAVNPDLSVQAEFYKEKTLGGDVDLRFNDDQTHREDFRQSINFENIRLGLKYNLTANQNILFSGIYGNRRRINEDIISTSQLNEDVFLVEAQHLLNLGRFKSITGIGYAYGDSKIQRNSAITANINTEQFKTDHYNAYIYAPINATDNLVTTLGVSFDSFDNGKISRQQFNPKFGVLWTPSLYTTIRISALRTLKRLFVANQTIEPTHVAGFNQYYDDRDGASAWQYGVGLDQKLTNKLYTGFESTWRQVNQPRNVLPPFPVWFDQNERSHSVYVYWTPHRFLSLTAEYQYEQIKLKGLLQNENDLTLPRTVMTHSFPLSLNIFHSSGFFTKWNVTYVNQDVTYWRNSAPDRNNADFWTIDGAVGYRLPKRLGVISVEATNLFNQKFKYHNIFDANGPGLSKFAPARQLFLKLRLSF